MPHSPSPPLRSPLLATKLFLPRARAALVLRPRLVKLLEAALTHPLTLVSAPAGFGKTTLVATWAQQQPLPVAWLSLDAADNDPNRFLRYLIAALQSLDPALGHDLSDALESGQMPPIEAATITLINDLAELPHDGLLVLDDFHLIDEPRIEQALATLVAHQPPQLHLLLAAREDPPLPLARLRGQGQLVELRAQDLRFSPEETATFLSQVMGLSLSPQQVAELDARIEGWVAGLQLAGLSLQKSDDPGSLIAGISSNHHFILTYLTEEVLRRQPAAVQAFLLQTSILERLSGTLCDTVCERDDSTELLAALYTANAFVVPLDGDHAWYRYHHLFRELLRGQLQRTQPALIPSLHRRAAAWYIGQVQPIEAIEHTLDAGDYAQVVALLEAHARPLVLQGYAQTVAGWLHRLPGEWQAAGPQANVAFAWSLLLHGQLGEIDGYLRNAEAALMATAPAAQPPIRQEDQAALEAEILALRAGLVSLRGETERACTLAREAVAMAPPGNTYVQGATRFCLATAYNYAGRTVEAITTYQEALPLCRAAHNTVAAMLSVANLSLLTFERGQLHEAAALCRRVIGEAEAAGALHSPTLASVYGALAHVLYEWNDLDEAHRQAYKALELGRRSGHVAAVAYGSIVLSRIEAARGDTAAAEQLLEQARQLRGRSMPAWIAPYIVNQQVSLALARHDDQAAQQALEESGIAIDAPTGHTREVVHLAYLRLLLYRTWGQRPGHTASSLIGQALPLAGRIVASAETGGRLGRTIEAYSLRALALQAQGRHGPAQIDLEHALQLAAPSGYIRLFAGLGAGMVHLLSALDPPPALAAYVTRLRDTLAPSPGSAGSAAIPFAQPALVEPLSEREIDVLRLMAQGLTYQEVAERLIVSLNTVRFHVKSIYGKLGVDNRTAALDSARNLQLL